MLAVFFALKAFQIHLSSKYVFVRIDSMTVVSDIAKVGTNHSRKRNNLTREIWNWCIANNMVLTTARISVTQETGDSAKQGENNTHAQQTRLDSLTLVSLILQKKLHPSSYPPGRRAHRDSIYPLY